MNKKIFLTILLVGCCSCAPFGSSNEPTLEQRVERQDIQIRQMQPRQDDAWNQIQAMRQEIDRLKGQINQMNNGGAGTPVQDPALQQPTMALGPEQDAAPVYDPGVPMTGMAGVRPTGAPDSSAYGAARTVQPEQGSYGLAPEPQAQVAPEQTVAAAPSESTWGQADPVPQPTLQVPQKDISLALFDAGVNSYNARDYTAAERSFSDFLKNYPSHSQAAEAQYYLAECQFQSNHFPEAALAYDTVIKKYPKSSSAPGAYLKQAICFSKMKQPAAAKARMQEIISKFPKSAEAARARTFLKTNK